MHESIFREYDIRGKVGTEFILDEVYQLGCAIAYYFVSMKPNLKNIIICRDGRKDSEYICAELARAFCNAGVDVTFIGVGPTPMMNFSLYTLPVDAGLMVTASHNGKEYNGIKLCLGTTSLWGEEIQRIKQLYQRKITLQSITPGKYLSRSMVHHYATWLADHFKNLKGYDAKMIFDLSGGATCTVMPMLLELLEWNNVTLLNAELDPYFVAHEPDPCTSANMEQMKELLRNRFAYGIAFDGDGDRMAAMTCEGKLISGDKMIAAFAQSILREHYGAAIVFDAKCSNYLQEYIVLQGGKSIMTRSGHSIIKYMMKKERALFAGELSCHFFFNDRYFGFDDGIYAALRLHELIISGNNLEKIDTIFPQTFTTSEIRIFCAQLDKEQAITLAQTYFSKLPNVEISMIDGVRVVTPYGWGVVRAANTQEALSLRFESDTKQGFNQLTHDFQEALGSYVTVEQLTGALHE